MGVGGNGYSWAAASRGANSLFLDFSVLNLNPTSAYYRVYGFQLRCLSE
ncbi:hypothetical protein [uncultured Rikenella sp.]|nr:hypothetical protein [uncultured Rikenella sp.]